MATLNKNDLLSLDRAAESLGLKANLKGFYVDCGTEGDAQAFMELAAPAVRFTLAARGAKVYPKRVLN